MRAAITLLLALTLAVQAFAAPASARPPRLPAQVPASTAPAVTENITSPTTNTPAPRPSLDSALSEALRLEEQIATSRQEAEALEQRIDVTNSEIFRQQEVLSRTEWTLSDAREEYTQRLVNLYKQGPADPVFMIFSAKTFYEFTQRMHFLLTLVRRDQDTYRSAQVAAEQAAYEQTRLEDMKSQLVTLRSLESRRRTDLESALRRERSLVRTLTDQQNTLVTRRKNEIAMSHRQWRESSIPIGTPIKLLPATVEPHLERYLAAEHQPRGYRILSGPYVAVCSWYGNEFNGRPTASGQIYNEDDLTCASRTLPFGTRLGLEREGRRVIVVVNDRGPFVAGRDLDLSKAAAKALGFSGVEAVTAEFVEEIR